MRLLVVLVLAALACGPLASAHNLEGEWPMFRRDAAHSASGAETAPARCDTLWEYDYGASLSSSPVAVDGRIHFGSEDGRILSLWAANGSLAWSRSTTSGVTATPAIVNGTLYVGDKGGTFFALDAATGNDRWTFRADAMIESSATIEAGRVFFGDDGGTFYALDAANGRQVWRNDSLTTGPFYSSPAVAGGRVFAGNLDGRVYALWASNGTRAWSYLTGGAVLSSPSVAGGNVYVGSLDGSLYAFDAVTRAPPWGPYRTGDRITASPAVADGSVFIPSFDERLHAVEAATGRPAWNASLGDVTHSSPAAVGGLVVVGLNDGRLVAVRAADGTMAWTCTTEAGIRTSPAAAYGRVFVASEDGKIYAFGEDTERTNHPPSVSDFLPSDHSKDRPLSLALTWRGNDPDELDYLRYDVRFGFTEPPPVKATGLSMNQWTPAALEPGKTYHWQVLVRDNHGFEAAGPTLAFTTATAAPPTSGSTGESETGTDSPTGGPWIAVVALLAWVAWRNRRQ